MITYTYIVKCPECEDEFFDFFDEAKEFALGCMSKKPIITQTEVERNDFGECTDHCDLGTVWSWEDMMKDTESEDTKFSKDETFGISEGLDDFDDFDIGPQIDEFEDVDNLLDFDIDTFTSKKPTSAATEDLGIGAGLAIAGAAIGGGMIGSKLLDSKKSKSANNSLDELLDANINLSLDGGDNNDVSVLSSYDAENDGKEKLDELLDANISLGIDGGTGNHVNVLSPLGALGETCDRKPVPEGMTIEELVEEMEENEDTVECTWCNDLFDKSECRKEVDLGWLCSRCEMAIKSRGETLTFKEGSYWDFLDEKLDLDLDFSNCVDSSDMEIWGLEHTGENFYKTVLLKRFNDVSFKGPEDEAQKVYDEMYNIDGILTFSFGKDGLPVLNAWNVNLLRKLGSINIEFEDTRYEDAAAAAWGKTPVREKVEELHDLGNEYDGGYPADSKLDELEEAADYRKRLTFCPECGEKSYDAETSFCISCGFN